MTMAKADLIDAFIDGAESGAASREDIEVVGDVPTIIGYGWAVYAARLDGKFLLFGDGYKTTGTNVGWAGYSGQTTQHLQEIKSAFEARDVSFYVVNNQLKKTTLKEWADDHDANQTYRLKQYAQRHLVEPREETGYMYRQ